MLGLYAGGGVAELYSETLTAKWICGHGRATTRGEPFNRFTKREHQALGSAEESRAGAVARDIER